MIDLDAIKPALEGWVKSLKNERLKYRLYAWDHAEDGVWVHLKVIVRKDGSEYSRFQVLTKKQIRSLP